MRYTILRQCCVGFTLVAGGVLACAPSPIVPSTIVVGRIWTGDSAVPWAQALAVTGDTVAVVGDSVPLLALAGRATEILRAGRGMIVPGFQDAHAHFFRGGFQLATVDLRNARSPEEFVQLIRDHVATLPPGDWVIGGDWDHELWPGAPLPERSWIDSVTGTRPVFLSRRDGHMAVANSAAFQLAGIDRNTPDVPGGEIVHGRDGTPTGVLKDAAMGLVWGTMPTPTAAQLDSALRRALTFAASQGVTAVSHVSANWDEVAALHRAQARGALTARVSVYVGLPDWRNAAESLRVNGPGSETLRVAGVKGMIDGSLGSRTAWFEAAYNDDRTTRGLTVFPLDSVARWVAGADSAGLQIVVHAIGDRANGWLLDLFDSVAAARPRSDRRWRIEHAQHLRAGDIPRFGPLGVIASMQPYHAIDDGMWAETRIGRERIKGTYAFRSLLDAGATLAFGSDWTVAPFDPLQGIYAAVTRRTLDDKWPEGWVPEQKITVEEALTAYTAANGRAMGFDRTGVLRSGYLADLVFLDQDLKNITPGAIRDTKVMLTMIGGQVVFRR